MLIIIVETHGKIHTCRPLNYLFTKELPQRRPSYFTYVMVVNVESGEERTAARTAHRGADEPILIVNAFVLQGRISEDKTLFWLGFRGFWSL